MQKEGLCKMRKARFCKGITAIGRQNVANGVTWKAGNWSDVPSAAWMRLLLAKVGANPTGNASSMRKRFKKHFGREDVSFSGNKWHILNLPTYEYDRLGVIAPSSKSRHRKCAIDLVYQKLWNMVNKDLDHNGESVYAEITRGGVDRIIARISRYFLPHLTPSERFAFRAIDLRGGFLSCLSHIAQVIPGEYAGIDYDKKRSLQFAECYGSLLSQHAEELCNTKIAYIHMNIFDLHSYDCDLVYAFDEAFDDDIWQKIVDTFVASPRCKFKIMFKAAKACLGYKEMQTDLKDAGLFTMTTLYLKKKGNESSNAMFLVKKSYLLLKLSKDNTLLDSQLQPSDPSDTFWKQCNEFWDDPKIALEAVAQLKHNTKHMI